MATPTQTGVTRYDGSKNPSVKNWLAQFEVALQIANVAADKQKNTLLIHITPTVFEALQTAVLPKILTDAAVDYDEVKIALSH